jgi:hypothetical protein
MALVLGVSLLVHVAVLWLVSERMAREPKPRRSQPINLVIRERPTVETPRIDITKAAPPEPSPTPPEVATRPPETSHGSGRPGGILEFPDAAPVREPTLGQRGRTSGPESGQPGETNGTRAPVGDIDLFRGEAVGHTAHTFSTPEDTTEGPNLPQRGELTAGERVASALDRMRTDQAAEQHVDAPTETPPALAAAQTEAERTFDPPSTAVAGSRKKCRTCQHEIGRLSAIVDVSRSESDGQTSFVIAQPSGDSSFDASALAAVRTALPVLPGAFAWSRWRFSAEVYRFAASELLLDPSFKPPGRRLATSGLGAMSMTTSVRLVAFR